MTPPEKPPREPSPASGASRAVAQRAWYRLAITTWLAIAAMAAAIAYTQSGAGMHWWIGDGYSTYEIENYGFPFVGLMQNWMTDRMAVDGVARVETWDWYPWAAAIDVPLSLLLIVSTGVVAERLRRSRGQASLAGILALVATIAAMLALWQAAPAVLAWMRSGDPYVLQFNNGVYIDMPTWLLAAWTMGIVCAIDTLVLTAWKMVAAAAQFASRRRGAAR